MTLSSFSMTFPWLSMTRGHPECWWLCCTQPGSWGQRGMETQRKDVRKLLYSRRYWCWWHWQQMMTWLEQQAHWSLVMFISCDVCVTSVCSYVCGSILVSETCWWAEYRPCWVMNWTQWSTTTGTLSAVSGWQLRLLLVSYTSSHTHTHHSTPQYTTN